MPITYRVDHARRIVFATGSGTLTDSDVFGYQGEVWSRPDLRGYDELVDMTGVEHIVVPSADRVRELAKVSASMDAATSSKFAIIAPATLAYGLGRMFQTYREMETRSTKEVGVFRNQHEAFAFLGIE